MNNVSHKNIWHTGAKKNVEPPPFRLIKSKNDTKSEKDQVKIKMHRDLRLEHLNMYEFNMTLFENGEPEETLLFVHHFNMLLNAYGMLSASSKLHYICNILHIGAIYQFDDLCIQIGSTAMAHLNQVILGLGTNFLL